MTFHNYDLHNLLKTTNKDFLSSFKIQKRVLGIFFYKYSLILPLTTKFIARNKLTSL